MIEGNDRTRQSMGKIAVFGGTFNPVHNGHIHIAKCFAKIVHADTVFMIPTNVPPHKQADDLAPAEDRLAMCRLAVENDPLFRVSEIEIRRSGPSFTSETIQQLREIYPESQFFLITGEDMFVTLGHWHDPETIYRLATICAAPRSWEGMEPLLQCAEKLKQHGAKTLVEPIEYLPISSTQVRDAVKAGKSISSLVPASVEQYIREHCLYIEARE